MSIRELPDKWRGQETDAYENNTPSDSYHLTMVHATELENALPVWTRISEDESSLPAYGERVMVVDDDWCEICERSKYSAASNMQTGFYWRPLCDLDFPPEES